MDEIIPKNRDQKMELKSKKKKLIIHFQTGLLQNTVFDYQFEVL